MAELADAPDLGSGGTPVQVQVLLSADLFPRAVSQGGASARPFGSAVRVKYSALSLGRCWFDVPLLTAGYLTESRRRALSGREESALSLQTVKRSLAMSEYIHELKIFQKRTL